MSYFESIQPDLVVKESRSVDSEITNDWTFALELGTEAIVNSLTFDNQNNIVAVGTFEDKTGSDLSFALKLSLQGELIWIKQWGSVGESYEWGDEAYDVSIDSADNIYVTGRVSYGVNLDNQSVEGSSDAYLLKIDSDGTLLWARYIRLDTDYSNYGWDYGEQVYTAVNSNIIVSSIQTDRNNFKTIGYLQSVRAYDLDGTLRWETILAQDGGSGGSITNILPNSDTSIKVVSTFYDGVLGSDFWDRYYSYAITTINLADGSIIDSKIYPVELNVITLSKGNELVFADRRDRYYPNTGDSTSQEGYGETWGYLKTVSKIDVDGKINDLFPYGQLSGSASLAAIESHPGSLWFIERLFEYPYGADKGLKLTARNESGEELFADQLTGDNNHRPAFLSSHTDHNGINYISAGWSSANEISIRLLNVSNPLDILISSDSFDEDISPGSIVASLATIDLDLGDTHSYSLVSGDGDADNGAFTIDGDQLRIVDIPDFETQSSYSIRIQTKDAGGLTHDKVFILSVGDINEWPAALLFDFRGSHGLFDFSSHLFEGIHKKYLYSLSNYYPQHDWRRYGSGDLYESFGAEGRCSLSNYALNGDLESPSLLSQYYLVSEPVGSSGWDYEIFQTTYDGTLIPANDALRTYGGISYQTTFESTNGDVLLSIFGVIDISSLGERGIGTGGREEFELLSAGDDVYYLSPGIRLVETGDGDDSVYARTVAVTDWTGNAITQEIRGGAGDDTYIISDPNVLVSELEGEGNDLIRTSVSYALNLHLENLELEGSEGLVGIGNSLNNSLRGNSAKSVLAGNGGDDHIRSQSGRDMLLPGTGADYVQVEARVDYAYSPDDATTVVLSSDIDLTLKALSAGEPFAFYGQEADGMYARGLLSVYACFGSYTYDIAFEVAGKNKFEDVVVNSALSIEKGISPALDVYMTHSKRGDALFLHDTYSDYWNALDTVKDAFGRDYVPRFEGLASLFAGDGDDLIDLSSTEIKEGPGGVAKSGGGVQNVYGGKGDDVILGADANVFGDEGDDTLISHHSATMSGGSGKDIFGFLVSSGIKDSLTGVVAEPHHEITDFAHGEDKIRFYLSHALIAEGALDTGNPDQISKTVDGDIEWMYFHHGSVTKTLTVEMNGRQWGIDDLEFVTFSEIALTVLGLQT